MSTIVTINGSDLPSNSRSDINTNFSNLNTDKFETSNVDTDTTLAANSDSKVPSQKAIKAYADSLATTSIAIETSVGETHSLTTVAGQTVIVWVTGTHTGSSGANDIELKYNNVVKYTITPDPANAGDVVSFAMMYTETPGAATANITVVSGLTLATVKIVVLKLIA